MATTTNYGWTTPNDTDLVKDGAAAIRTLGSAVDTTTKNLNPETTTGDIAYRSATANVNTRLGLGTAGQVLRVNSGATAPEWATTADQTPLTTKGDLFTFDTADARLPVGANGHTLVANSATATGLEWKVDPVADLVTTAGDTLYATAADTLVRLGIGTAGQVLTVNSGATAPEWVAPAGGLTFAGVSLQQTTGQSISNNTDTFLTFDTENFDTDAFHDDVTNNTRITIPAGKGGYYQFNFTNRYTGGTSNALVARLFKNGVEAQVNILAANSQVPTQTFSVAFAAAVSDYFQVQVYQNSGGTLTTETGTQGARFQAIYLGA